MWKVEGTGARPQGVVITSYQKLPGLSREIWQRRIPWACAYIHTVRA